MAERDPFGRLPDENPLAGLGWLSDGSDGEGAAEPVAADWGSAEEAMSEPVEAQERPPAGGAAATVASDERVARQMPGLDRAHVTAVARRVIFIVRIFILIVVVVVTGLIVLGALVSRDDEPATTPNVAPEEIPALPAPPPPAPEADSGTQAAGLQSRSLMARNNVSRAMRRLATSGLGRLRTLRIAPARRAARNA